MKRTLVAVALVVVFVMALATPALAAGHPGIMHTAAYELDGTINFEKQMGHLCNTGAEIKQTISGNGFMEKEQTVNMVAGKITMDDANDWVAGATALTVTTVWELCAPSKYTYTDGEWIDGDYYEMTGVVHPLYLYGLWNVPAVWSPHGGFFGLDGQTLSANVKDAADFFGFDAVSSQIWAVQVQADPGFSGNLHQKGEAAEGPYWGTQHEGFFAPDDGWTNNSNRFRWENDEGAIGVAVGDDYVGSYFTMDQHARTSMGTLRRFIDISSPWSHGYLMEDMSVVGKSDVQESFAMTNLPKGADIVGSWWDLF